MSALRGFRGRDKYAQAWKIARRVSAQPRIACLDDGSIIAVGDTLLRSDGSTDVMYYGARGTYALASEVRP